MAAGIVQRDFFISFNSADADYAAAIDAALRASGFTTYYHPRDLADGGNIAIWMDDGLMNSAQTLALYSPDYVSDKAVYSKAERYATWWQDPVSDKRKLIPIILHETTLTPLIAPIKHIDVKGLRPDEAAERVVERLKSADEAKERDHWRSGQPLPKIFSAPYRPNPNFTGRFEAMESLQRSLSSGNAAITAVAGMGGIGKTTLASEYCHRFGGRYGGVWWVRAEQETTMLADLQALGQRLEIVESAQTETDARATLNHLASVTQPWLLVFDNAPNPDAVRKWLPTGAARCIITSRFTEFGDVANLTRLDQWSDEVTAEYLLSRTNRDDAAGAKRLAEALDGLPLAAEQAATFLGPRANFTFDDYAADIARLVKRKRDQELAGGYPDTVYAAFVRSLETLQDMEGGETALDILRLCSFLSPDGVDFALLTVEWGPDVLPAALAVAMANKATREDALAALTSMSLLRQEDGPAGPVLVFRRLLLEVVRDWMGAEPGIQWSGAAVRLVGEMFPGPNPERRPESWPLCARLLPHVVPLEAHAPRTGDPGKALDLLLNQAGLYLAVRGDREGALTMNEQSVAIKRTTRVNEPVELAAGLNNLGSRYVDLDRPDEAEIAFREALAILESRSDPNDPPRASVLNNLAQIHLNRHEFAVAERFFLQAAEIMKAAHGEKSGEYGLPLSNLGALYSEWADEPGEEGRREQEEEYKTKALDVTRAARGSRHPETATRHNNLVVMKAKRGDWSSAEIDAERAVAIMLSLDLARHPSTHSMENHFIAMCERSGQADKAARLRTGDISDLLPVIAEIETEHRAWVAEDPENRRFGPQSFFEPVQENLKEWLQVLETGGINMDEHFRQARAGQISRDDFAKVVAETLAAKRG